MLWGAPSAASGRRRRARDTRRRLGSGRSSHRGSDSREALRGGARGRRTCPDHRDRSRGAGATRPPRARTLDLRQFYRRRGQQARGNRCAGGSKLSSLGSQFARGADRSRDASEREGTGEHHDAEDRHGHQHSLVDIPVAPAYVDPAPCRSNRVHVEGHVIGVDLVLRQPSSRVGSLPRRTVKRVYLPISPALEILTSSTAPTSSERSKRVSDTSIVLP